MSNEDFLLLFNKNDQRYHKVWIATTNPKEFKRLMRFENCELISVPSICDKITLKLNEEANHLESTQLYVCHKSMRSFLAASQLFIGLIHVHEQQVQFLYDLAAQCSLPKTFPIESVSKSVSEEELSSSSFKKALKRKSSSKGRQMLKRIALVMDSSDEPEDIETQNIKTMELLQNAFVSNNADISIRESLDGITKINEATHFFDIQFNEETVPEQRDFDNALLQDDNVEDEVPLWEPPPRRRSSEVALNDTIYGGSKDLQNTENVSDEFVRQDDNPDPPSDSIEMEILEENKTSDNTNASSRKRRRRKPFKDLTLNVNVKENVTTVETTLRHAKAKDDSVSKATCLSYLSRKIFAIPSHSIFSESMSRQFETRSMSDKLLESFQRMTLTKTEETNPDMVQEFCSNKPDDNQPSTSSACFQNSVVDVPVPCQEMELTPQVDEAYSYGSQTMPIPNDEISNQLIVEQPSCCQHVPVELSSAVRQILVKNESVNPMRCATDSQKLFASRSRQNKLDWGPEGVLQKLISLWNGGIYPISMKEIMQSNKESRIAAGTAFFSVMELNSARIGLIDIIKSSDSNVIFNIIQSPKLIELQQIV